MESPRVTTGNFSGITFEGVSFDSRSHRLAVVDQAAGPGSAFPDAVGAARSRGGIAAVNAGFFTPEGAPLGLVVSLDGGRSSELWISETITGGPISRRPAWNRPVRNFLIVAPR